MISNIRMSKSMKKEDLLPKLDEWILEQKYQEYAPSTLNQYRANVMKFIDWLPEDEEITKKARDDFLNHALAELRLNNIPCPNPRGRDV